MTEFVVEPRRRLRVRALRGFLSRLFERGGAWVGVATLTFFLILAVLPSALVGPLETATTATGDFLTPPDRPHPLGTDEVGRDVVNLVVHGARISLTIALIAAVISLTVGSTVGITAGYFGGKTDT